MTFENRSAHIVAFQPIAAPHLVKQTEYISFQEKYIDNWTPALSKLVGYSGVENRYSYLENWQEIFKSKSPSTTDRNKLYEAFVVKEVVLNLKRFIEENDISLQSIGGLITVSCTGIANPSLDTKLVAELKLQSCLHWHIGHMGCHGGVVGLQSGAALCALIPEQVVLVVCIEACSLHYQESLEPDVQVSNSLFSDGCAIVAMRQSSKPCNQDSFHISQPFTRTFSSGEDLLTWNMTQSGWLMGLSSRLPSFIKATLVDDSFARLHGNSQLVVHPGGKAILAAIENALEIPKLSYAHNVLRQFGNMSSATIFFCLRNFLDNQQGGDTPIPLLAFGPGLDVSSVTLMILA